MKKKKTEKMMKTEKKRTVKRRTEKTKKRTVKRMATGGWRLE